MLFDMLLSHLNPTMVKQAGFFIAFCQRNLYNQARWKRNAMDSVWWFAWDSICSF